MPQEELNTTWVTQISKGSLYTALQIEGERNSWEARQIESLGTDELPCGGHQYSG